MAENYINSFYEYNPSIAKFIGLELRKNAIAGENVSKECYFKFDKSDSNKTINIEKEKWMPNKKYHQAFWALNQIKSMNYFVTLFMSRKRCSCEIWDEERTKRICIYYSEKILTAMYNAIVGFILYLQKEESDGKD